MLRRIQEQYDKLRRSERIVADYLRDHTGERLDASITDFARTLGVSEATISRLSRALGYDGYSDMKISMAGDASLKSSFANIPATIYETDPLIETSHKLASVFSTCLFETQKRLDVDRIERAIDAVTRSTKVVFIGVGGAAAMCEEAAHLFLKTGVDASSYSDGYTQTIVASNARQNMTMVGVSHTGSTRTVANALELSRANGASTIAITSNLNSDVGRAAEIVLTTWHHTFPQVPLHGDFLEGRLSQLYLINVLYLGLLFRSKVGAKEQLARTTKALERYYGPGRGEK